MNLLVFGTERVVIVPAAVGNAVRAPGLEVGHLQLLDTAARGVLVDVVGAGRRVAFAFPVVVLNGFLGNV